MRWALDLLYFAWMNVGYFSNDVGSTGNVFDVINRPDIMSDKINRRVLTFRRRNFLLNFSTLCISNVNNTGTKKGSIMK